MTNTQQTYIIRDLDVLKVLTDPLRQQMVDMLIHEPLTPKQIAAKLGLATSKLYYHLTLLEQHGLIAVVETRTVANLIERVYRATFTYLEIDPSLLSFSTRGGQENIYDLATSTLNVTRDDVLRSFQSRAFNIEQGIEQSRPRTAMLNRNISRLSEGQYQAFFARLEALVTEFATADESSSSDDQLYALTIAFYPSFYYPTDDTTDA